MRIRTIKPEFWSHPIMSRLPADAQLLAIALLNLADDEGYFLADANLIRASCRPLLEDSGTITVLVKSLIIAEWIEVSWSDGRGPIGRVTKFLDHQVINKPKKSKIKQYWGIEYNYGTNPEVVRELSGISTGGNGREWIGKEQGKEGANFESLPPSEGESMAKKKDIVDQGVIPPFLAESPDFMEAWTGFLEMRVTIKRPATEYAQKLLLKKLAKLSDSKIPAAIEILEESITKNWQDVYAIKKDFGRGGAKHQTSEDEMEFTPTGEGAGA